jgi:hypothetical protein
MNPIGPVSVGIQLPQPGHSAAAELPVLPKPSTAAQVAPTPSTQQQFDATADEKQYQVIRRASEDLANFFVVGDSSVAIFKDATGQYVTRYTSLRDGKVTYIPQPKLMSLHASQNFDSASLVKIEA